MHKLGEEQDKVFGIGDKQAYGILWRDKEACKRSWNGYVETGISWCNEQLWQGVILYTGEESVTVMKKEEPYGES